MARACAKWDRRFLELAAHIAQWSKDPSTKTGAVLVRPDRTVAGLGYNGFPRQMRDKLEMYEDREVKYDRVIHGEMNALLTCPDPFPLSGYTIYTIGPCCSRCTVHLVQAGLRNYVFTMPTSEQSRRWGFDRTKDYWREASCSWTSINPEDWSIYDQYVG